MVRREISITPPRVDRLGIIPLLIRFAERAGWSVRLSEERCIVLMQEFRDEAAASAATIEIDDVLTHVGSFCAAVR